MVVVGAMAGLFAVVTLVFDPALRPKKVARSLEASRRVAASAGVSYPPPAT